MTRRRPLPPQLAETPFHVRESDAAGVPRSRTRALDLRIPYRGVRVVAGELDHELRCRAYAARMPPGHVFSHATAAAIWGIPLPRDATATLHVAAPAPLRQPRMRGVTGHRLGAGTPLVLIRGLPVVAACDAWCQLGTELGPDALIVAGDRLLGWPAPLASAGELERAVRRFGTRRGVVGLRRALTEIRPGSASPRETRLRLAVLRAGYPEPECNGAVDTTTLATHGDLVFRLWRVILEYDGEQHRTDAVQFDRDVERLNALAVAGWTVVRVSRTTRRDRVLADLDRALRVRGWHP